MKPYAERIAITSERRVSYYVKLGPCGHHSCALSAGCIEMADCCEHCPLPDCRYNSGKGNSGPTSPSGMRRAERDMVIMGLKDSGISVSEIAETVDMSCRHVWHVLAKV